MESIGVWYLLKEDVKAPTLDFHINLWNLKLKNSLTDPFIDFGIGINDFRNIKELKILFPFSFDETDLEDLFAEVREPETARLIFNDNECEISSKDKYSVLNFSCANNKKLLFKIKSDANWEEGIELKSVCNFEKKLLNFNFESIQQDAKLVEFNDVYIRFRITTPNLYKALFCTVSKKNWFLESGFIATQILDIKINEERNLPHNICRCLRLEKWAFAKFSKIHLLVMSNSNDEICTLGNGECECRKLEEQEWGSYLKCAYDTGSVLAYHWKEKCKENRDLINFSKLIKISTSTTNIKMIAIYMLVVILLGACGSGVLEIFKTCSTLIKQ